MTRSHSDHFQVAAIQMVSSTHVAKNLETTARLVKQAAQNGAQLVVLPEFFCLMGLHDTDKLNIAEMPNHGPIQTFLTQLAAELQIYLIAGTVALKTHHPKKILNSCLVFDPSGKPIARYDKIHLFSFRNTHTHFEESQIVQAGQQATAVSLPFGRAVLAICYDIRFPELFRAFRDYPLIVVPAAFTYETGQAHWEVLLRARAIENQCYLLAAAQGGTHENGRKTWGQSLFIDPWGNILAQKDQGEGMIYGTIALQQIQKIRQALPALTDRVKLFS